MTDKKENIQWLDSLRTLATLGVIVIHISSSIVHISFHENMEYWWIGNFLMSVTRFAVPMFLLLSGATMLGREYNLKEFYRKRLTRVVVPFLFWMVIYFFFRYFTIPEKMQPSTFSEIIRWAGNLLLTEGVSKHFWYIYMIVFVYLFVPMLTKIVKIIPQKYFPILLIIWFFVASWSIRFSANMYLLTDTGRIIKYLIYMGYLFMGWYLTHCITITSKERIPALIIFLFTIFSAMFTVHIDSIGNGSTNQSIYNYMSYNTIIQAVSLFILIKDWQVKNTFFTFVNKKISDYSYGIYLVHVMILGILYNQGVFWTMYHPAVSVPVIFILTLMISFMIIFVIRTIPFGKYISG